MASTQIEDERKDFILTTTANYFNFKFGDVVAKFVSNDKLNDFLESGSCLLLSATCNEDKNDIVLENKVVPRDSSPVLIFAKTSPDVVTKENLHSTVFVSSLSASPVAGFYHIIEKVYAPMLLKDDIWSQKFDTKLQDLVKELESGLRLIVHPSIDDKVRTDENVSVITSPADEASYWAAVANTTSRRDAKERSTAFFNALEPMGKEFSSLDSLSLADVDEVVEIAYNSLDDLWKLEEYPYPQPRMEHLLTVTGKTLSRFIQSQLRELKLWKEPLVQLEETLHQGIAVCEKWIETCQRLTTLFWPNYPHAWRGEPFSPVYVKSFVGRLREILYLRTLHYQLTRVLSKEEQEELKTSSSFQPFAHLNPILYNPYTEPEWRTAVKKFEQLLRPTEDQVGSKLKGQLRNVKADAVQLLHEFERYEELIKRPAVKTVLLPEREGLLSLLRAYLMNVASEFNSGGIPDYSPLLDMPEVVCTIYWVRQLEEKVENIERTSEKILDDLKGYEGLKTAAYDLKNNLMKFRSERFDSWSREANNGIKNKTLCLRTDEPVVCFEQGKMMKVNYDPRLMRLIREARQLAVLGYDIPSRIIETANHAKKFIRQAKALEQVATFHNTIGDRMIAAQRPMMLAAALDLSNLVKEQQRVTWSDVAAVDKYIGQLQKAVERLSKENNKLAAYHIQIREMVIQLMDTDLLRHQQKWKEILKSIRDVVSQVEAQFKNTKSWKIHLNRLLYAALECQYQVGLEALNDHLPEMKVELVYRQQKLQFSPPVEELRMEYYRQLKRFLAIPNNFRGVDDGTENVIFPFMIHRNASRFVALFKSAENMFAKLNAVKARWRVGVALGSADLELLAKEHLHTADDWDRNFRASKAWGQEIGKLPVTEEKVECFSISFLPVRAEIELHNRRYWDFLVTSLHSSILRDVNTIDKFCTDATELLSKQPQTVEEIGVANQHHAELMKKAPQMGVIVREAEKKNKTLGIWAKERVDHVSRMVSKWDNFQSVLDNHQYIISKQVEGIKNNLKAQVDNMQSDVEKFKLRWEQARPREDSLQEADVALLQRNLETLREKRLEWEELTQLQAKLEKECEQFSMPGFDVKIAQEIEADLKKHEDLWSLFEEFSSGLETLASEEWVVFRSKSYRLEEFLLQWQERLKSGNETTSLTVRLLQEIERYKSLVPCLKYLRGEMFGDKHWMEMFTILGMPSKPVERLTFGDFLAAKNNIADSLPALQDLNSRAASEIVIRQALGELDIWEVEAKFTLTEHSDSQGQCVKLIKDFKDILNKVGDNQCLLQSIKNSPNYDNFIDRAGIWEQRLADLDIYLHNLNQIQRKWVYLEPIFGAGTLSQEKNRFQRVDHDFRNIMRDVASDNRVVSLCRINNLRRTLDTLLDQLGRCQKSLNDFLEEKRSAFPRFYFLGDDDLLEILGQSTKERVIQSHLKKLFAGINSVVFDDDCKHIVAMRSLEGETVQLRQSVKLVQQVEEWLANLAKEMQSTLKQLLLECLAEARAGSGNADPLKFPSQILCLTESVFFTERCERAIGRKDLPSLLNLLKGQLDSYTQLSLELAGTGTGGEGTAVDTLQLELRLKALLLDTIHHISIVEDLIEKQVTSVDDWPWQQQLRFSVGKDGVVMAQMVDAQFRYTYEYQGNAPKLVHTPLTDKCYLTLTQGMHLGLGGNPYGPAGTGKTESVKALGGLFGRQVLVFNCDEGIDVKSMARIFVGLVKCGAWGCFDEFNRLEEATLSAISMQIQPIQMALKTGAATVVLMDEEIPLDPNAGIFVTLNPAGKGYGGRQKLPDNLKQLFRPVVMSHPDSDLIAEVILFCEGFKNARIIGRKLVELFDLCKKLLTPQQHYDWGLRALKTVLGGCGAALKAASRATAGGGGGGGGDSQAGAPLGSLAREQQLVVRALRLNTLSKLTFGDGVRFDALLKDVFPGAGAAPPGHDPLRLALHEACQELALLPSDNQLRKCLELHEQLQQRMGVVVVGPSGSGKTTLCKLLKTALGKLGQTVKQHTINPKAMPRTQLLGQIDLDTRQWTDGVLTLSAQQVHAEPPEVHSWIVCDGDVDPEWIESLNSVLDDNRLLTLPSGWRIQFGPNVNFLFETHDLSYASPATVSRMGIIFLSDEDIDVRSLVTSWLTSQSDETSSFLSQLIEDYFYKGVDWVVERGEMVIPTSRVGVVQNGLSHLNGITCQSHFIVAMTTGLGGNLTTASREEFIKQVFDWAGEYVPDPSRISYTYYNEKRTCLDVYTTERDDDWRESVAADTLPLALTADAKRTYDAIKPWLQSSNRQHFLLVGPFGCGKSTLLEHAFSELRATDVATVHCSAQITPQHVLQKLGQVCMVISSNKGRVYKPKNSDHLILYFKDLNLARPDKWGTSMLVAFLQQVITYGGFYDNNLEWVGLENVQIVGSLTAGATMGRHPLTPRFTSITCIYAVSYSEGDQLKAVYTSCLGRVLHSCLPHHPTWRSPPKVAALTGSMISIYDEVKKTFTPVAQNHYIFTPRDLTRWCLGLRRYEVSKTDKSIDPLLEVVIYEALRLFRDKLVSDEDKDKFDMIVSQVMDADWNRKGLFAKALAAFFVTSGATVQIPAGAPLPTGGKPLGYMEPEDWTSMVERGMQIYGREGQTLDLLVLPEMLAFVACLDRVLSSPRGSLLLAGRAGVGRKSAVRIASAILGADLHTLKMGRGYGVKHFKNDLKNMMQQAGVEGQQMILLLEDHQLTDTAFFDMVNSILSCGEVPGLYNLEELESTVAPLKDLAAQEGFVGNAVSFFFERVNKNMHIVLVMDFTNTEFTVSCESNPALFRQCTIIWQAGWSAATMRLVPQMLLAKMEEDGKSSLGDSATSGASEEPRVQEASTPPEALLIEGFQAIHAQALPSFATPRRYIAFIHMYRHLYGQKKQDIVQRCERLQAGVSKLTEARQKVAKLKVEAGEQQEQLAIKQEKANAALSMITDTMRNANTHRSEMEALKVQTVRENQLIMQRKKAIDEEMAEVEPILAEASAAVGNIKTEALSEIRSLRAPPEVIRDILEGVLLLMGIKDTSWNSMKNFLAQRGVKEDIKLFDARRINSEAVTAVERLLNVRGDSFEAHTAKRASAVAAPLAAWVKANVRYSRVLEKIRPLEQEQKRLQKNLNEQEEKVHQLSTGLSDVDRTVAELKEQLNSSTKEAAELEIKLMAAQHTLAAAEGLVAKLDDEYQRWRAQLADLSQALQKLPVHALLAAAFLTYLAAAPEGERASQLKAWATLVGARKDFSPNRFLASEQQQLQWQAEGLPADALSLQNAMAILKSSLRPLLVDPSSVATEWLRKHLTHRGPLEVVAAHSERFPSALELAVRFGKALLVLDVDRLDPVLFPILRGDFINQGPRKVVQLGEKLIDYNDSFQLFLATRDPEPAGLPPDAAAVITCVNFTITWTGLTGQLLGVALRQERPALEERRRELLRKEEKLRQRLDAVQEALLQELASAQGDLTANEELLTSLNRAKESGVEAAAALRDQEAVREELAGECNAFQPLAEFGASLFFALAVLDRLVSLYRFSVAAFSRLFQKALAGSGEGSSGSGSGSSGSSKQQRHRLQLLVYQYASRALFKKDRLTLALQLVRAVLPEQATKEEWELLTRESAASARLDLAKVGEGRPSWVPEERAYDLYLLKTSQPALVSKLQLEDATMWAGFAKATEPESTFPVQLAKELSTVQRVLVLQALRPDRLHSALVQFALQALGLQELSPPGLSLKALLEETLPSEPILLVLSAGADPGEELRSLASATVGPEKFFEVALGQGQAEVALERLATAARDGHWLCLKNLHLMMDWLPQLEKRLRELEAPHADFRLWLTAEAHPRFPPLLAQACLKVTYEAPQGVKRNLQRTYAAWGSEALTGGGSKPESSLRAKALFALAWFHAVVQERRTYIPQGWAKFYEFSDADLRAAVELLRLLFDKGSSSSSSVRWEYMRGLCENAIYGGRVDNEFDLRVLASYLREFFNNDVLTTAVRPLGPGITLPPSANYRDYLTIIHQLSDKDKPDYFGLPANVERSWQRITSNEVIGQLRALLRPLEGATRFDREEWLAQLAPLMNLWKKLNQGSPLLQQKSMASESGAGPEAVKAAAGEAPVALFIRLELTAAAKLVFQVHRSLGQLSRMLRGTTLPTRDTTKLAEELLRQQTPALWQQLWEGPSEPLAWVRAAAGRSRAVHRLAERGPTQLLREPIDLANLLHPTTFLSALKQHTARELGVAVDELRLASSWARGGLAGARGAVTLAGLQMEGAAFDGQHLCPAAADAPALLPAPAATIAWVPKATPEMYGDGKSIALPLYYTAERERVIVSLDVPCTSNHDRWLQTGAAFFLKN